MVQIGIAAFSGEPPPRLAREAEKLVNLIADKCPEPVLLVGGYWGLMRIVVDAAIRRGVVVVVLPPLEREDILFPRRVIVVRSGLSYRLRSVVLVRSSDVLVALGGAAGTIQEIVTAYTEAKPVVLMAPTGMPSDKMVEYRRGFDDRHLAEIIPVPSAEQAVQAICSLLERGK